MPALEALRSSGHRGDDYLVVERSDYYVDKQGGAASQQSYDHDIVRFVLAHDGHKIYAECDLSTLEVRPERELRIATAEELRVRRKR